jgi:hypothetical protein
MIPISPCQLACQPIATKNRLPRAVSLDPVPFVVIAAAQKRPRSPLLGASLDLNDGGCFRHEWIESSILAMSSAARLLYRMCTTDHCRACCWPVFSINARWSGCIVLLSLSSANIGLLCPLRELFLVE